MNEENNMETLENTIDQGEPSTEQSPEEQVEGESQPENEQFEDNCSEKNPNEDSAFLPIRFNHEDITLSREDAIKYAQLGKLYYESGMANFKPIYSKLDYFAATQGVSPEELIDSLIQRDEELQREKLVEKFGEGGEELEILMKAYRERNKDKYDKILQDRTEAAEREKAERIESNNNHLADGFMLLKKEFPEITDIASVPNAVKKMAVTENKDLLTCYLLHRHREQIAINAANKAAEDAKNASTGSGASTEKQDSGALKALLKGIWN